VPETFDSSPVALLPEIYARGDDALAVRHADRNEGEHERLALAQVDEVHGNGAMDRVYVDPVDAPAAVGHERAEIAVVAVVAHVVHEGEGGGLVRVGRVARRESEVGEEVRAHLDLLRGRPGDLLVQKGAVAEHGDEPDEVLRQAVSPEGRRGRGAPEHLYQRAQDVRALAEPAFGRIHHDGPCADDGLQ